MDSKHTTHDLRQMTNSYLLITNYYATERSVL